MANPLEHRTGYLLRSAARVQFSRLTQRLSPLGISVTEASTLVVIGHNPGVSQVECSRLLNVQRSNLNPVARRLLDHNWIRVLNERGKNRGLILTEAGVKLTETIEYCFDHHESVILGNLPIELRAHVLPFLQAIFDAGDDKIL